MTLRLWNVVCPNGVAVDTSHIWYYHYSYKAEKNKNKLNFFVNLSFFMFIIMFSMEFFWLLITKSIPQSLLW